MTPVTIYYLEMKSARDLKESRAAADGMSVEECRIKQFEFNRFLYAFVGGPWQWTDKLVWDDARWKAYVEDEHLRTWVAWSQGAIAGYFELQQQADGDVEISYFGLTAHFIGKGFGGKLLTCAIDQAWQWQGTKRVWVHTCTLDHPGALQNYLSRGMRIYKTETEPSPDMA